MTLDESEKNCHQFMEKVVPSLKVCVIQDIEENNVSFYQESYLF